jgi:hypothetical protein
MQQLRDSGEVEIAEGSLDDLAEPLRLDVGQESPSAVLARLRHGER